MTQNYYCSRSYPFTSCKLMVRPIVYISVCLEKCQCLAVLSVVRNDNKLRSYWVGNTIRFSLIGFSKGTLNYDLVSFHRNQKRCVLLLSNGYQLSRKCAWTS